MGTQGRLAIQGATVMFLAALLGGCASAEPSGGWGPPATGPAATSSGSASASAGPGAGPSSTSTSTAQRDGGARPDAATGSPDASTSPSDASVSPSDVSPTSVDAGTPSEGADTSPPEPADSSSASLCSLGPQTTLHYTAGWGGDSTAGALGFNLADISSASDLSSLPTGTLALVYLGLCNGADANFIAAVQPFSSTSKVYGFYLMDEPDPTGQYSPPACSPANLKEESDWIHANVPGAKTFIVMMNLGSDDAPSYDGSYNPSNSDIDLYGLDPYPCQVAFNGCHTMELSAAVAAAKMWGIPEVAIVPVYQAFGGGGYAKWQVPSSSDEQTILTIWGSLAPKPAFDYAYAWGSQESDTALGQSVDLQPVFAAHNTGACISGGD